MKRYLKNLWAAICGRNPYQEELTETKRRLEQSEEDYKDFGNVHDSQMIENTKQISTLQTLVENFRERIKEKDELIDQMKKDYQRQVKNYEKRVGDYSLTIDALQKKNGELQEKLDDLTGNASLQDPASEKKPKRKPRPRPKTDKKPVKQ